MSDRVQNRENISWSSLAYSLLDEEKLDSADYFEFRENAEKFIEGIDSTEGIENHICELRKKLESLERIEMEEDKTSSLTSRISLGAMALATVMASMSNDVLPIGVVSSIAVLVSTFGYSKKIVSDNKEVVLAKEISTRVRKILSEIEKTSN